MRESLKIAVQERAKHCCEYCLASLLFSTDFFSIKHILPISKGGLTEFFNLAFFCQRCNIHKFTATHATDPATGLMAALYNPRTDRWSEHFEWYENFTIIRGISPTGRATEKRLVLNRIGVVNLRGLLVEKGYHPPY
jgi:5-methylcytosine-specific restriction endonuclease McrA